MMVEFVRSVRQRQAVYPYVQWRGKIIQIGIVALLCRARLVGECAPFVPAYTSAALSQNAHPLLLIVGAALGTLSAGFAQSDKVVLFACVFTCALWMLEQVLFHLFPHFSHKFFHNADGSCMLRAALSALFSSLMYSDGLAYHVLIAALNGVVAGVLAPALVGAMNVRFHRRRLMPDEQLSLVLLILLLLIALSALPRTGEFLAQTFAVWLTLVGSFAGCGMGALAGICAGSALSLGGSSPFLGASLCLCGVLSGCMKDFNRFTACVALGAGSLFTVTWGLGYTVGIVAPISLLTGCVMYCLMPRSVLDRMHDWMMPRPPHIDSEQLAVRVRRKAGRRLSELSGIFGELADGYEEENILPSEKELVCRMRGALCKGCEGFEHCWKGKDESAKRTLCRLAQEVLCAKGDTKFTAEQMKYCRRQAQAVSRLSPLLGRLAAQRRAQLKRGEARSLMGHQFREAQNILNVLSTRMGSGVCLNEEFAKLAQAALDRAGIHCREVLAVLDDRLEIICGLQEGTWSLPQAQEAARLLSVETGLPFAPILNHGRVPDECELYLMQCPALTARYAALSCSKEAGIPCGDSHMVQLLSDGQLMAAISDGMGNGVQAAQESGRCISLLRKFVGAGIDRNAALNAVNRLLLMRGGDEMFATADLCVVNLYSGIASFSKLGACCSFVLQEKGIRRITGGKLPLGILDSIEAGSARIEVYHGDMLIMISDGIADELKEGQQEALRAFLPTVRRLSPEQAVRQVMDWAKARDGGICRDDMTVIAIRMIERGRTAHFSK